MDDLISQLDAVQMNARDVATSAQDTSSMIPVTSPINFDAVDSSLVSRSSPIIASGKSVVDDSGGHDFVNNDDDDSHTFHEEHEVIWRTGNATMGYDSDSDRDFTACSAEDCGYCGRCDY